MSKQTMTPRERDPLVWAATYGAAYAAAYHEGFSIAEGAREERAAQALTFIDVDRCKTIADAAVMALHPGDTFTAINGATFSESGERVCTWTEDEIRAAWYRAQETSGADHVGTRKREPDDMRNSWEHVRAALHGEPA